MAEEIYTLGMWRAKPGKEAEFIAAWQAMGQTFRNLPLAPTGVGTLVQSLSDLSLFYSFGPWQSLEAVQAMRQNPSAMAAMTNLRNLCSEAAPGTYRVVARA